MRNQILLIVHAEEKYTNMLFRAEKPLEQQKPKLQKEITGPGASWAPQMVRGCGCCAVKQKSASSETECIVSRCSTHPPLPHPPSLCPACSSASSPSRPGQFGGATASAPAGPAGPDTLTRWAASPAAFPRNCPGLWKKGTVSSSTREERGGRVDDAHRCRWTGWRSSSRFPGRSWRNSGTGPMSEKTRLQSGWSLTDPLRANTKKSRERKQSLEMHLQKIR